MHIPRQLSCRDMCKLMNWSHHHIHSQYKKKKKNEQQTVKWVSDVFQAWFWIVPSQWETSLQSNAASHLLGANQESSLYFSAIWCAVYDTRYLGSPCGCCSADGLHIWRLRQTFLALILLYILSCWPDVLHGTGPVIGVWYVIKYPCLTYYELSKNFVHESLSQKMCSCMGFLLLF